MINLLNNNTEFVTQCWALAPAVAKALHPEAVHDQTGVVFVCNHTRTDRNPGVSIDPKKKLASDWAIRKSWSNPSIALAELSRGVTPAQIQTGFEYALRMRDDVDPTLPQVFHDLRAQDRAIVSPEMTTPEKPLYFHVVTDAALATIASAVPPGVEFSVYPMRDRHGAIQHVEVRMVAPNMPKEIRPYSWVSDTPEGQPYWRQKAPPVAQLFGTENLRPGKLVLFCEGPKTAAAAQLIFGEQVAAVSLASNMLSRTTFEALKMIDSRVVIWPDNDAAGYAAAARLSGRLSDAGITHVSVTELELSIFPGKWDLADPLPEAVPAGALHTILRNAQGRLPQGPDPSLILPRLGPVEAFPLDTLPEWAAQLVVDMAKAASCPPDYVATTLLAVVGTLMTGRFPVSPLTGFVQNCSLYVGNAGPVSARKSPGQRMILDVLDALQAQVTHDYHAACMRWEALKAAKAADPGPEPAFNQLSTSNATIEALVVALGGNEYRAILASPDELDEWLTGMHKYTGGGKGSGDLPQWLSVYDARFDVPYNRASFNRGSKSLPLFIPLLGAGVVGSLQDDVVREVVAGDMARSVGMMARLLLVRPDPVAVTPLESRPALAVLRAHAARLHQLFTRIYDTPARLDSNLLVFDPAGERAFDAWYRASDAKTVEGYLDSLSESKASGHIARLAGILHVLEHGHSPGSIPPLINERTVRAAMRLRLQYFKSHAQRIERIAGEPQHERLARNLAAFIVKTGAKRINLIQLKRESRIKGLGSNALLLQATAELIEARWIQNNGSILQELSANPNATVNLPAQDLLVFPSVHTMPEVVRLKQLEIEVERAHGTL